MEMDILLYAYARVQMLQYMQTEISTPPSANLKVNALWSKVYSRELKRTHASIKCACTQINTHVSKSTHVYSMKFTLYADPRIFP